MKKKSRQFSQQVYYPTDIPDTVTDNIDNVKAAIDLHQNQFDQKQKDYDFVIQRRIASAEEDRETHAINTIIKWAEAGSATIQYNLFNYYFGEWRLFSAFLNKLKAAGCLSGWSKNPYKDAYHAEIILIGVNIPLLQQFSVIGQIVQFLPGQTVMYQNGVVFFKLGDGTSTSIDFSNAPSERRIFEVFWNLRRKKIGQTEFTGKEIAEIYFELNKSNSDISIAYICSNIRKRYKNKTQLSGRFILQFNNNTKKWVFNLK